MIKKVLFAILALFVLLGAGGYLYYRLKVYKPPLISQEDLATLRLMPLPAKLDLSGGKLIIGSEISISYTSEKNELIEQATARFTEAVSSRVSKSKNSKNPINLVITCLSNEKSDKNPLERDESYSLVINKKSIVVKADSPYGILYGLETLKQLIERDGDNVIINCMEIQDKPRFAWRGLMLDVSRHWIPKEVVLRIIDGMAAAKLNVFHWHLSDDQGFRVENLVFPKLHEVGSNGKYYTQTEIREVIEYAGNRGIRVVPEFDLPGHSLSWQIAYPELSSSNKELDFIPKKGEIFTPPLDPSKELGYEFLDQFIAEMASLFPDPYFHIGGDEVNPAAWLSNAAITEFMRQNNIADAHALQAWFISRAEKIIESHGKKMIGWDEILHPELSNEVMVQCWRSQKSLFEAVQQGTNGILSAGYYLDHKLPAAKLYAIDPLVLPGAVDIVPDTAHWKMYDLVMDIAGNKMENQMVIFDRDTADVFGYFAMLDNRMPFKNGTIQNGILTFKFNSEVGELNYSASLLGDSLNGKINFGLMGFGSYGKITGSSEMPGTVMPKIEIIKPLTPEESARITGGEACMWSELADGNNVESRIWPRAAAIAEKLWSPQELTTDTEDMYRRLEHFSLFLETRGSYHNVWYRNMLKTLTDSSGLPALETLTDVLEEVKYVKRLVDMLSQDVFYLPDLPLERVADIVYPESFRAYHFNKAVDEFLADESRTKSKQLIFSELSSWAENHQKLATYFESNEKLLEIKHISEVLSDVALVTLDKMNGKMTNSPGSEIQEKLTLLETGENGVFCAVAPGLRKLLTTEPATTLTKEN